MTATQISDEVLESYVKEGLEKLRRGDLWISFHLQENDVIFEGGNSEPDPNDKGSNYFKFFDSVAADIATNFVLDKKDKKRIRQKLHSKWRRWQEFIAPAVPDAKLPSPKKIKSVKKAVTKIKKEEETFDHSMESSMGLDKVLAEDETPTDEVEQLSKSLEEKKRKFEEARDLILADVPQEVKARFGKIFFTKWGKQTLPCLAMNPYSVPPGNVRDMWLDMYDKVKASNRLQYMTILIYWYGSSKDPTNAYSFIEAKKLIPYETAVKKNLDQIPEATVKKYKEGKLTAASRLLVEGMMEMNEDLVKEPHDRFGWMSGNFTEAYLITSDEEDDPSPEKQPIVKKKKPKNISNDEKDMKKSSGKKRKQVDEESLKQEVPPVPPKKKKKKKMKSSESAMSAFFAPPATLQTEPVPLQQGVATKVKQETVDIPLTTIPQNADKIGMTEFSNMPKREELDEDYKFAMADSGSDGDNDEDEDFNISGAPVGESSLPLNGKKALSKDEKERPKKKEKKIKHKIEKSITKDKEVRSEEQRLKRAQTLFAISEKEFNPIFVRWQQAIDAQDEGGVASAIDDISSRAEKIHFSLMTDINDLLKASKKILSDDLKDEMKKVRSALKVQYDEKKKDIPPDFKPNRKFVRVEAQSFVETPTPSGPPQPVKSNDSSNSVSEEAQKVVLSAPIKRVGSLEKVAVKVEPKSEPEHVPQKEIKVERKKFSLGNLMRPASEASKGLVKSEKLSCTQLKQRQQQVIPDWVTGKSRPSKPDDDNRAFALEFLQQAVPFIPNGQDVDHGAIAHALEAAIYESVKKNDPSWIDKYWKKVDDIVVAISGDKSPGSIAVMIARGEFQSPESVVQLPDTAIYDSFLGRPIFISP